METVLKVGAADSRGGLGAEGQGVAARPVGDEVHLLLHDIRHLPDSPHKEVVVFEDRRVYLAVGIPLADGHHHVPDTAPSWLGVGQDVFRASG